MRLQKIGPEMRSRFTKASNKHLNTKSLLWLLLLHKLLVGVYAESRPRITIEPQDLIAIEGEATELNCDAEGDPEPTIEWYHNGHLIKASSKTRTTMGGSIQFLDIRPVTSNGKPSDAGTYHCLARNALGQARSRNATLQVAYIREEFRVAPKDKLAAIGDSVTFECLPQAWPEPTIRWKCDGRLIEPNEVRLPDGSVKYSVNRIARTDPNGGAANRNNEYLQSVPLKQTNRTDAGHQLLGSAQNEGSPLSLTNNQLIDIFGSQLVIKQIDKHDEAKYSCLVETKGSHRLIERESPGGQLTALVKPYFVVAPEHKTVQVGAQVKLRCQMGGDPEPVISWRKQNGQPLSEKIQIDPSDKTLILDQVTIADQATYVCEGENSVGSARTLATVTVISRPKFTVTPTDQDVESGARVQIRCSGQASPQPMLFWYKEGHRQLMFAPSSSTATSPTKKQNSLDFSQSAALIAPDNKFGAISVSDTSPATNKLFSIPINQDIFSMSNNFGNNYFGNRIYVDGQGTLNIINATSSDNGYYACALISSVGSILAKAKLTVRHSPDDPTSASDHYDQFTNQDFKAPDSFQTNSRFDLLPPPVIKFGAVNQTLPVDSNATLICEVVSQVTFKILWLFESQPIHDPPRIVTLESGALSINNSRISDSGVYTCVVTAVNEQTMNLATPFDHLESSMLTSAPPVQQPTSHSTTLKIASLLNPNIQFNKMDPFKYPSSPGAPTLVLRNGSDAIIISWTTPSDPGTLPIREYVIEHYDTYQEHLGWRVIYRIKGKEQLLIDGLSAFGSHFFVVRAANGHGVGPSSAISGPWRTNAGEKIYEAESQKRRLFSDRQGITDAHSSQGIKVEADLARDRLMTTSTTLLTLTPVASTSIRLQWSSQFSNNSSSIIDSSGYGGSTPNDFLDGYSIRYRSVGIGESILGKDPVSSTGWSSWSNAPSSLPLVTSYVDGEDDVLNREKRSATNLFDFSQEFNEVRVIDQNTDYYTINNLRPFTLYQFFVVPFYKDIDGVPSNILSAQTQEDRPSVAPPNLTIRPINNTAVRLLWLHIPAVYTNGILRGYVISINRSDVSPNNQLNGQQDYKYPSDESHGILNLPLSSLIVSQLSQPQVDTELNGFDSLPQYVVMYDITNLTYKSFYSFQVAGTTSVGIGPWSEPQNFVMDPKVLSQMKVLNNEFEDVLSKSLISTMPQTYSSHMNSSHSLYVIMSICLLVASVMLLVGYLFYRRNNQKVMTWKKTISEHFNNKFYMPSTVDHRDPNPIQQNIYDHQQHLIYSGSTHMVQQPIQAQNMWANNCVNSSGTGSLSSHNGLIPISNDPSNSTRRVNGNQVLMMSNKDTGARCMRNGQFPIVTNQQNIDTSRPSRIIQHGGDYYSVINNMAEYEELNTQQRGNMQLANGDRHQTASSNSDTSCPSSVTRLLPNQNYNRDLLAKNQGDIQRHEMILQQQVAYTDGKQPFMVVNGDVARMANLSTLSPYATTNLMNQVSMHQQPLFPNNQMPDNQRQQIFIAHNGNSTMDDSSKILINHQANLAQNPISSFRTLQRNPVNFQTRGQPTLPGQTQMFNNNRMNNQNYTASSQFHHAQPLTATNISVNPLMDLKPNLYEHIEYSPGVNKHEDVLGSSGYSEQNHHSQMSGEIISSSTSSGSVKSPPQQNSPNQHTNGSKFRRPSENFMTENEAHDLRVFSSKQSGRSDDLSSEKQRLNFGHELSIEDVVGDDNIDNQIDETTAFRQKSSQSDSSKSRQLSKRRRQQQRNRLHNSNQKVT